ncbi:MAG: aconitate hydratase AcnA, partial [Phycisphaerales bacterium]|nr:aconitate hydratase AcnA [Phycisphaerales bacterium]
IVRMTGDNANATKVNPLVPCDLVIDHSVQVDAFASGVALSINSEKEFERNNERYQFLKWGQQAFDNFRVVPPATGIVHQVNLEYLAKGVWDSNGVLYPDSLVGTDSHTTMINGLGVVGWGVGGIEAEAVMLGQPIYMLIPEVVGFKLTGKLAEGCTATDLVLRVTEMLRKHGVVGRFVEFFGEGLATMPLANRATIANMAPEYGATMGFFPVDEQTLTYMRLTGRDEKLIQTVEQYCKAQGLWRDDSHDIQYTSVLELDMSTVEPSLAGPKRPQDRIALSAMGEQWRQDLSVTFGKPGGGGGSNLNSFADEGGQSAMVAADEVATAVVTDPGHEGVDVTYDGSQFKLKHGAVVIAAITSCTNTSNPEVMIAAGLLARKARKLGLTRKPWVKTSLAPGSKVVTEYYNKANLTDDLDALGFNTVGYGCTTCIGNSGPLPDEISKAINANDLVATSVLSGNRNFEGRISPDVKANYLASPPLVVAYAIAGTVNIDLQNDVIAKTADGRNVFLKDIWPTQKEVQDVVASCVTREQFTSQYADVFKGSQEWQDVETSTGALYDWKDDSTYVQEPPFFVGLTGEVKPITPITGARCLAKLGDSVTTDHISPAGSIKSDSPAGKYLTEHGVPKSLFNSYGSRRGNDRVMTRGTFANIRVKNQLAPGTEGGYTTDFTTGLVSTIYDASLNYKKAGTPLVVLAGIDYGMGSSRDWAAKGTFLLGVKAVIASSYERIHRSNLVGMGVLPLQFKEGATHKSLGLTGEETFDIAVDDNVQPRQVIEVTATKSDGKKVTFDTVCRIDTPVEVDYYRNGGILHTVLRKMAKG